MHHSILCNSGDSLLLTSEEEQCTVAALLLETLDIFFSGCNKNSVRFLRNWEKIRS